MRTHVITAFAVAILTFFASSATAQADDCVDCLNRKQGLCAQECRLVGTEKSLKCQRDCSQQYCLHRCPATHPAVIAGYSQSCEDCLDQQFNLCEPNCPNGTDRIQAMCKLGCSKQRCELSCADKSAAAK